MKHDQPNPITHTVLHVGAPFVADRQRFLSRVENILDSGVFTNNGPCVGELETLFKHITGTRHCIALCNATLGLELLFECLGLTGDVVVPSFTFVSTVSSAIRCGLNTIFADLDDPGSPHISAATIERSLTEKTSAVIVANLFGACADLEGIIDLCAERRLKLIFDSAHAIGTKYNGTYLGGFGDAEVFSLHATKFIQGFEGGLVTTNNDDLADALRLKRNFGFVGYDNIQCIGTNAKLSEIHAAMALTNMERMDDLIGMNFNSHSIYSELLQDHAIPLTYNPRVSPNYQYFPLRVEKNRDALVSFLHSRGILARKYFYPGVHRFSLGDTQEQPSLPVTDSLCSQIVCLPMGGNISRADQIRVADCIAEFNERYAGK